MKTEKIEEKSYSLDQVIENGKLKIEIYQRERFVKFNHANQQNIHLNNALRFADTKAGALVAANGVVSKFITDMNLSGNSFSVWSFKIGLLILAISILLTVMVVFPNRLNSKDKGVIYWKHIQNYKKSEYIKEIDEMEIANLLENSFANNYDQAAILTKKFSKLHKAFSFSVIGYVFVLLGVIIQSFT